GALVAIAVTLSLGSPGSVAQTSSATISGVNVPVAGKAATATTPAVPGQTGNAPKANFFLPGDTNFDTALFKNVPLKENFRLQLRVETYNTFNHAEFNGVNN